MSCLSGSYLKCKNNFKEAWKHHYKNNPHHWEYWLNDVTGEPCHMPLEYLYQMIADWEGMTLKFGDTAQQYYLKNYKRIKLEYSSRLRLELELGLNESELHNYGHTMEDFANMYDEENYNGWFGFIKDKYGIDTYEMLRRHN